MVRIKGKKEKGDDAFKKQKQKVGKKKLAPVTATKAEVHAASLRIVKPEGDANQEGKTLAEVVSSERRKPIRALRECIAETTHYKDVARAAAFAGVARYLSLALPRQKKKAQLSSRRLPAQRTQQVAEGGESAAAEEANVDTDGKALEIPSPLQMLNLLQLCFDRQTDGHSEARKNSLSVLRILFEEKLPLDLISLISFVQLPLTHAERPIKATGLELLDLLLEHYPAFAEPVAASNVATNASSSSAGAATGPLDSTGENQGETLFESLVSATAHAVLSMPPGSPAQRAGYAAFLHLLQRLLPTPLLAFNTKNEMQVASDLQTVGRCSTNLNGAGSIRITFFQTTVAKIFFTRICNLWNEISDVRAQANHVLRDPEQAAFGCTLLQLLSVIGTELVAQGALNKSYLAALKGILSKFPFSVNELTRSSGVKENAMIQRWKLALGMMSALLPVYGTSPDTTKFVDSILVVASQRASSASEEQREQEGDTASAVVTPLPIQVEAMLLDVVQRLLIQAPEFAPHNFCRVLGTIAPRVEQWVLSLTNTEGDSSSLLYASQCLSSWVAIQRAAIGVWQDVAATELGETLILSPAMSQAAAEGDAAPAVGGSEEGKGLLRVQDFTDSLGKSLASLPKSLFLLSRALSQPGDAAISSTSVSSSLVFGSQFSKLLWYAFCHRCSVESPHMAGVPEMLAKLVNSSGGDCMIAPLGPATVGILRAASLYARWKDLSTAEEALFQ